MPLRLTATVLGSLLGCSAASDNVDPFLSPALNVGRGARSLACLNLS